MSSDHQAPVVGAGARPGFAVNLRALDVLRGVLAVYVLCSHARWLLWEGMTAWRLETHPLWSSALAILAAGLRFQHEAVMVFFVLSGFFIHLRCARRLVAGEPSGFQAASFLKRRAHRLLPPYVLALLVTVICDFVGRHWFPMLYQAATGDALLDENFIRKGYSLASVLPALVVLPVSWGLDFGTNGPLWSLAFEVVYYLLYLGWIRARGGGVWLGYGLGLMVAVLTSVCLPGTWLARVMVHYPVWLAGAALAEWVSCRSPGRVVAGVALLALAAAVVGGHVLPGGAGLLTCYATGGFAVVLLFAMMPAALARQGWFRAWEWLGVGSYSIYICHFPMLTLISAALLAQGGRPSSGWIAVAGAGAVLVLAVGCFFAVEKRFLHERLR